MPISISAERVAGTLIKIVKKYYPEAKPTKTNELQNSFVDHDRALLEALVISFTNTKDNRRDVFLSSERLELDEIYKIADELDAQCHHTLNITIT